MEEHSLVKKRSVAELAGKFSCPISHTTDAEVNKPVRRRPPRSLPLSSGNDAGQGQDEKGAEPASAKKNRNSALIEKLQASLALSPTGPAPFPKSPGVKLPVPCFSPGSPSSPSSPPASVTPKLEENPASFESPAEGTVLKSINKGRARHSIKRRPPSRRHRKSSTDDGGEEVDKTETPDQTTPNGHEGDVFEEHKTSADAESLSSKEQIEQETKSTDSEKPEEKVETVTSEKEEGEEKDEKTEPVDKEEKTGPEDKEEKTEPAEKKEKTELEGKEEKTEPETKEEKSEDEPQLAEETREEPVTQPQTGPDTTDEKEEEQKEEVNL